MKNTQSNYNPLSQIANLLVDGSIQRMAEAGILVGDDSIPGLLGEEQFGVLSAHHWLREQLFQIIPLEQLSQIQTYSIPNGILLHIPGVSARDSPGFEALFQPLSESNLRGGYGSTGSPQAWISVLPLGRIRIPAAGPRWSCLGQCRRTKRYTGGRIMNKLQPEEIADQLWARIDKQPGTAIYTLTWDDVVSVLANEMSNRSVPPEALTDQELAALLEKGGDVELPWEETIEILLGWNWPELRLFEAHNTGQGEDIFHTTSLVWKCECQERYLHPRNQDQCSECQVARADAPDARNSEVLACANELPATLLAYLQQEWEAYMQPEVEILTQV